MVRNSLRRKLFWVERVLFFVAVTVAFALPSGWVPLSVTVLCLVIVSGLAGKFMWEQRERKK